METLSTQGGGVPTGICWSPGASISLACLMAAQAAQISADATGFNKHQNYKYPKYEDALNAAHPFLVKYQCLILFSISSSNTSVITMTDANGKDVYYSVTSCTGSMYLIAAANPLDWVASTAFGFAMDKSSDKALKAHTICRKYALKGLFGMTDNNDPDDNNSDVRRFNTPAPGGQVSAAVTQQQWSM